MEGDLDPGDGQVPMDVVPANPLLPLEGAMDVEDLEGPGDEGEAEGEDEAVILSLCEDVRELLVKYLDDAAVIGLSGTCHYFHEYLRAKRPMAWIKAKVSLHLASCVGPPIPFLKLLESFEASIQLRFVDSRSIWYRKPILSVSANLEHDTVVVVLENGRVYAHHVPYVGYLSPLARARHPEACSLYPIPQVHYFRGAVIFVVTPPADRRVRGQIHTVLLRSQTTEALMVDAKYSRPEAYRYQSWQSGTRYVVAGREPGNGPWLFFLIYDFAQATRTGVGDVLTCRSYDLGLSYGIQANCQGVLDLEHRVATHQWTIYGTPYSTGERAPILSFQRAGSFSLTISPFGPSVRFYIRRHHPELGLFGLVEGSLKHSHGIVHLDQDSKPILGPRGGPFRHKSMREALAERCFIALGGGFAHRRVSDPRFLEFHRVLPFHPYVLGADGLGDSDDSGSELEDEDGGGG